MSDPRDDLTGQNWPGGLNLERIHVVTGPATTPNYVNIDVRVAGETVLKTMMPAAYVRAHFAKSRTMQAQA